MRNVASRELILPPTPRRAAEDHKEAKSKELCHELIHSACQALPHLTTVPHDQLDIVKALEQRLTLVSFVVT